MNVIVLIIDSLRKDHVGAYGAENIKTPNIDALADESLRFERAYPESLPTVCARRAIHTGMRTFPFRNWNPVPTDLVNLYGWQPIPEEQTTLAEVLQAEEFETMYVTDVPHGFKPYYNFHRGFNAFEFVRGQERDFYRPEWLCPEDELSNCLVGGLNRSHMTDVMRQHLANTVGRNSEEERFAPQVYSRATELLEGASRGGQPFFMVVDNYDPHEPWDAPEDYVAMYDQGYEGPEPRSAPNGDSGWDTERQIERMNAQYSGEITMTDKWLGRFMQKFYDLGLDRNTMIVCLSDHGFILGEHGVAGKFPGGMYPEVMEIAWFLRLPNGAGAGQSSDFYASTHDVAPTVLGALGLDQPYPLDVEDLSVIAEGGEAPVRDHFSAGYHDYVWSRDEQYAMTSLNTGSGARLYDLQKDPGMNKDIAAQHPEIARRMYDEYVKKDAGGPLPTY